MSEEPDYEAKLLRQVMIRRLVMGVGALTVALSSFAVSTFGVYATLFTSAFAFSRPPLRMIMVGYVLAVIFAAAGLVTLRRGEIDLDTGSVHGGEPVPVRLIAIATGVVGLALGAIAAWPLGVYDWVGGRFSKCRELITVDELSELAGRDLEAGELSEADADYDVCTLRVMDGERAVASVAVHEDHWSGGWEFNQRYLSEQTPVPDLGTDALRGRGGGFHQVGLFVEPSGAWIQLAEDTFDADDVDRVIALLRERHGMIEPYRR